MSTDENYDALAEYRQLSLEDKAFVSAFGWDAYRAKKRAEKLEAEVESGQKEAERIERLKREQEEREERERQEQDEKEFYEEIEKENAEIDREREQLAKGFRKAQEKATQVWEKQEEDKQLAQDRAELKALLEANQKALTETTEKNREISEKKKAILEKLEEKVNIIETEEVQKVEETEKPKELDPIDILEANRDKPEFAVWRRMILQFMQKITDLLHPQTSATKVVLVINKEDSRLGFEWHIYDKDGIEIFPSEDVKILGEEEQQ
jgi:DNA repair exonuclease SbcCD ATPase subunit